MEVIRNTIISEFEIYKREREEKLIKIERKKNRRVGVDRKEVERDKVDVSRNQEWKNLTRQEIRGLKKLKQRVKKGELVIVKSDKSGKIMAMDKREYLKIGVKGVGKDKKITREEVKKIEERVNDHTRFWIKMTNIGENNGHHNRMKESKLSHSEQMAPRYYMYKDLWYLGVTLTPLT